MSVWHKDYNFTHLFPLFIIIILFYCFLFFFIIASMIGESAHHNFCTTQVNIIPKSSGEHQCFKRHSNRHHYPRNRRLRAYAVIESGSCPFKRYLCCTQIDSPWEQCISRDNFFTDLNSVVQFSSLPNRAA